MIIIFLIDILINTVYNIPSNLIISYLPYVNNKNVLPYFLIIIFLNFYYYEFWALGVIIIGIMYLINKTILKKTNYILTILINNLIYYLAYSLLYNTMNIISFFNQYIIVFIFSLFAYHILPKLNIRLFR